MPHGWTLHEGYIYGWMDGCRVEDFHGWKLDERYSLDWVDG